MEGGDRKGPYYGTHTRTLGHTQTGDLYFNNRHPGMTALFWKSYSYKSQ